MPFLTIGTTPPVTVPVAPDGANLEYEMIGDRARAFDGTMRSVRRGTKRRWQIKTALLTAGEASTILGALGSAPLTCGGDLMGGGTTTVNCDPEVKSVHFTPTAGADRRTIEFTLHEV